MEPDPILNHPLVMALQAECAASLAKNAALQADNAALRLEMTKLRETMERLEKLLEALQGRLAKDSHNSHKPPGSDGPQAPPRPPRPPTGRKRGGQPGHPGKTRDALPEGSEKLTVEVKLTTCPHCSCVLPPEAITGGVIVADGEVALTLGTCQRLGLHMPGRAHGSRVPTVVSTIACRGGLTPDFVLLSRPTTEGRTPAQSAFYDLGGSISRGGWKRSSP